MNGSRLQQLLQNDRKGNQREDHREEDRFRKREVWKSKLCARLYRKPSICLAPQQKIHRNAEERRTKSKEKGKKITSRTFLMKAILAIREKIRRIEMFPNLPVKDRFENFRKNGG